MLGTLVNAVFLVALCFSITIEACKRFLEEEHIHQPEWLLIVGIVGLLVNIFGLGLLYEHGGHSHKSLAANHDTLVQLAGKDDNENNSFIYQEQIRQVRRQYNL